VARYPFPRSLGEHVAAYIEAVCVHGPGDVYGQPVRLTGEEVAFLDEAYRIDPATGRRQTDIAVYSRRKGTRKSELGAWLLVAETTGPVRAYLDGGEPVARPPVDPMALCAATTEEQGDLVYGAFRAIVAASSVLTPLYDVGLEVTYLVGQSGKIELKQSRNPAALDGGRPTFEVGDEGHLWHGPTLEEAFATLRRNLRKRHAAQPWIFLPTTAYAPGQDSIAERLHLAVGKRVGRCRQGRTLVDHRQASERWDLTDAVHLREAIIEAGGDAHWSDTDAIASELADGGATEAEFRRFWLNQPTTVDEDSWLPRGTWEACRRDGFKVDRTRPFRAAMDMALKHDTAALRVGQELDDGAIGTEQHTWVPLDGDTLDVLAIEQQILDLHNTGNLKSCAYDPAYFEPSAQRLRDAGVLMVEFPQSNARMVPACGLAYELAVKKALVHDDEPLAAGQVVAAAPKQSGEGWRLSKGRSKRKIDGAIALVMVVGEILATPPEQPYDGPLVAVT